MARIVHKYERLAVYLPLLGTATILIVQNFFQDFLVNFRINLAIATLAISIILVAWFIESRIISFSANIDRAILRIDRLAEEQPKILSAANSNFQVVSLSEGFRMASVAVPRVDRMRIFAASSSQMHTFVQHNKIRVEYCSVLIQSPSENEEVYASDINRVVERWKLLVRRGFIAKLEVLRYNFQPTEYECIFDSKYLIHGLFDPSPHEDSGVTVRDPMVVSSQSPSGAALVAAYIERYDTLFQYCRTGYGPNDAEMIFGELNVET